MTSVPPGLDPAAPVAGPPPGWHPDPWRAATWRWWDGVQWTPYVWPLPWGTAPGATAPATRPPSHMGRAFWPSVGWMLVSILAGIVAALPVGIAILLVAGGEQAVLAATVTVFYPVAFGGFWLTARRMSRRHGTGDLRTDFGWRRFRAADIGWGVLAGIAAMLAQALVGLAFPGPNDDSYRDAVFGKDPNALILVVMGLAVVIGAPLFEELLFRGPIMHSLVARYGAWRGIVLQGGVFALYHVVGDPTLARPWYLAPLFVVGIIFGIAAHRTGRMATSQIAHAVMNTIAFAALLATL